MATSETSFPRVYDHGQLQRVVEGVYYVEGEHIMQHVHFPRGMTVINEDGALTLINPVRLSPEGEVELEALGEVKYVLCIGCHDMDAPYYAHRYAPTFYALPGRASKVEDVRDIREGLPCRGKLGLFPKMQSTWAEAFIVRDDVLITCDSLQNWEPERVKTNWLGKWLLPWYGFAGKCIFDKFLLNHLQKKGMSAGDFKSDMALLLDVEYKYLLSGHGYCVDGTAKECAAKSFDRMFGSPTE